MGILCSRLPGIVRRRKPKSHANPQLASREAAKAAKEINARPFHSETTTRVRPALWSLPSRDPIPFDRFLDAIQNDVRDVRFTANTGRYQTRFPRFSVGLRQWVRHDESVPARPPPALRASPVCLPTRMQTVADEKRDHHDVPRPGECIAITDTRLFFHERRVNFCVHISRPDEFHLPLNGLARVFIVRRAVAGNEQGRPAASAFAPFGKRATTSRALASSTSVMESCPSPPGRSNRAFALHAAGRGRNLFHPACEDPVRAESLPQ